MFAQKPRAVQTGTNRYKYRPEEEKTQEAPRNLLNDRRVVRGNTYAAQVPTANQKFLADLAAQKAQRKAEAERQLALVPPPPKQDKNLLPVQGRRHMEVQTDDYLEDLDDAVFEQEQTTQTDPYDDKPPPESFQFPHPYEKRGVDKEIGVAFELFDFDTAVEPILQALMGKSLDCGQSEVLEEEELKLLEAYQKQFTQERTDLFEDIRQQEEAANKFNENKIAHVERERARLAKEKAVARKVASINTARNYLANLHSTVIADLENAGVFVDPARNAVRNMVEETIKKSLMNNLEAMRKMQEYTDKAIDDAVTIITSEPTLAEKRAIAAEEERQRLEAERLETERIKAEEDAARKLAELEKQAAAAAKLAQAKAEAEKANAADSDED